MKRPLKVTEFFLHHFDFARNACAIALSTCITGRWRLALCGNGIALRLHNILRVPANTMQHRNRIYIIPSLTYYMFIFWEASQLIAPASIPCSTGTIITQYNIICYSLTNYVLWEPTTYCSYLQILHNFEQSWIISNSGTMDHHFRSRCPELPRGSKTPKVRTSTRIVRSGPR